MLHFTDTKMPGVVVIEPDVYQDERGSFYECWHQERYCHIGINETFVQDNRSVSQKNVLRGLHFQRCKPNGQLIWVTTGNIFDVAVDLRSGSKTFGNWRCFNLSADKLQQIYLPPGIAHGFCVLSEYAVVNYKCTELYDPNDEGGLLWNSLNIPWPINTPILNSRDQNFCDLKTLQDKNLLPRINYDCC